MLVVSLPPGTCRSIHLEHCDLRDDVARVKDPSESQLETKFAQNKSDCKYAASERDYGDRRWSPRGVTWDFTANPYSGLPNLCQIHGPEGQHISRFGFALRQADLPRREVGNGPCLALGRDRAGLRDGTGSSELRVLKSMLTGAQCAG
jgi:hypothetical protein